MLDAGCLPGDIDGLLVATTMAGAQITLPAVVVAQRRNAAGNPLALHRDPLTVDDVLASPLVCAPLRLLEIVRPASGASAFVVTTSDRAADAPHSGVWLLGFAERISHAGIAHMPDLLHTPVADT